ncbi:nicotianamine synthase-like [Nicotiana tabacum]|uniref:Nicotianamine synthase n=1 Tax=Nicotiana tabacum TaxID=4097 RepID=A0A1S3XAD3_TOBAC|nr:PREDICTED: nicotianamine synthase-like [Nicotiana tabacum]
MVCQSNPVVEQVCELYEKISKLESLNPSKDVNMLFTELVNTCMPPNPIDVSKLCQKIQEIRSHLIKLCGEAEGLLESHYSKILGSYKNPLHHLNIFPYFDNYIKLSLLEFNILTKQTAITPARIAFVGSGPLPLTSLVLATKHLKSTYFDNYDIDSAANSMASRIVASDPDLSQRMAFLSIDIMDVTYALKEYNVVFLAALVGVDKEEKIKVINHLAKYMAPGATLMLRSAHGARAFLYPVVNSRDLKGFEVLSIYHPTDEVINSVVIARKLPLQPLDQGFGSIVLPSKCACAEIHSFNPINKMNMIEELSLEEQLS